MKQLFIRRPPTDYVFNEETYRTESANGEFGDSIRHLYPELGGWKSSSIAKAWEDYIYTTTGVEWIHQVREELKREEDFLAFLFAEQELRGRNLLVRSDGNQGVIYSLTGLDDVWGEYDCIMEREGKTPKGITTSVPLPQRN